MVSAGCAAGLKHVTAACVAGGNPEKLLRIPDLTGFDKTEVVAPRSARSVYDHAIRNIGVKMITVESAEELERALNSRTAMIYLSAGGSGPLALENVARMAKPRDIPILVDAAAEVLTIPSVHLQRGATVVAYSGGKAICGPQCAGLLLGRKDILLSAWQASAPHHGPGPFYLRQPALADMVVEAIRYNAIELGHYRLWAFVVMPNHVHLLVTPVAPLPKITKSLKGITAKRANLMLALTGRSFWQEESYDHLVRHEGEFEKSRSYIEENPVRAGLVAEASKYRWSSAGWATGGSPADQGSAPPLLP